MATDRTWTYRNREIRIVTTPATVRLYIDGELLDTTNDVYESGDEATLTGVFENLHIEVFANSTDPAIRVNGEFITRAYAAAS